MPTFTKLAQKILRDRLDLSAAVEEEGTGKSYNIYITLKIFSISRELQHHVLWNNMAPHSCNMEASCAGVSRQQEMRMQISYSLGKLSFIDTPKIYDKGSNVEGKVSACGLYFFSVILYIQKHCSFAVIHICFFNRLKQFILIIHPFLTCRCTCLRMKGGQHVGCWISQLTAMVSPVSHWAQLSLWGTSTSK